MTSPTASQKQVAQGNDEQAIRKLSERWLAAMRQKDIAQLTSMVTEDAIFLPPAFPPIRGRQAVEAMYHSFFPQFRSIEQTVDIEEVQVAGDWAFAWGTEKFVLVPLAAAASPIEMEGKAMSILRRQADGSWKFARGVTNTAPRTAPTKK